MDIKDAPNRDRNQGARYGDWTTLGSLHTESVAGGVIESISGPPYIPVGRSLLRFVIVNADGTFVGDPYQVNLIVREPSPGSSSARPTVTPRPTRTPMPTPVGTVPQAAQPDGSIIHEVQPRDTLGSIAAAYGVTVEHILELNNIDNPNLLLVGQRIVIRRAGG